MKILFIFLIQVFLVSCQDQKQAIEPIQALDADRVAEIIKDDTDEFGEDAFCVIGTIALPPQPPFKLCKSPNEVYACAFGEARCDGLGYCGTPPCTWRCWCKNGFKRDSNGRCVKMCALYAEPFPIQFYE